MSDHEWGGFSWGPEKRPTPPSGPRIATTPPHVLVGLALAIVVLLAVGLIGVAIHHGGTKTTAAGAKPPTTTTTAPPATTTTVPSANTPAGFDRVLDVTDHVTLAIPAGWESDDVSNDSLARDFKSMLATDPKLAPLLAEAAIALTHVQFDVFAVDPTTGATLYVYGAAAPSGVTSVAQIPTAAVVNQVEAVGGKDVHTSQIRLPVGPSTQLSLELTVDKATIAEALDYFVLGGRLVYLVVESRDSATAVGAVHQIEPTVAAG